MIRRRSVLILMVVLAGAVLAGCGGAAAPAPAPTAAPGDPTAAPTPQAGSATVANTTSTTCADPIACANGDTSGGDATASALPPLKDTDEVADFGGNDNALFAAQADFGTDTSTTSTDSTNTSTDAFNTETSPSVTTTTQSVITVTQARVSIDDEIFTVKKGSVLPKDTQQFEVTALSKDSVTLTLTAGEFPSGSDSFSIKVGQAYKLVNQNEGTTYVLKLVSVS